MRHRSPAAALGALLLLILLPAAAGARAFPRYRDLAVYTTSAPEPARPATIVARTQFVNRGARAVRVTARLRAAAALGFRGARYAVRLRPGATAEWRWTFTAPEGFAREVLGGEIALDGNRERDLYLAVLGADPPGFADPGTPRIDERARVVATCAPRAAGSIRAEQAARAAHPPRPALTLAAAGRTAYAIVTEALPAPPAGQDAPEYWNAAKLPALQQELAAALEDLRRAVQRQTGAVLPIRAAAAGPAVLLRQADLGPAAAGLQGAYRLRTAGGNVLIEAPDLEGLRNGVYGLLTDHLGCHWFQPKELGEEIALPVDRTLRLPALDEVRGSRWFSSPGASWGTEPRWDRRNRAVVNRGRLTYGHAWATYINPKEYPYEQFPDYYARDREGKIRLFDLPGASATNFCSTNPAVIEIVARKVNDRFRENPDALVLSLDPNDTALLCLCDRCLALDRQYGQAREDGARVADRLLHFSQQIYDRLEPPFKDRYLGMLIYNYQIDPPVRAVPHPHHAGMIVNQVWHYDFTRPWDDPTSALSRPFQALVAAWGRRLAQFGYYDFYSHYTFFGPWVAACKMREDLPAFHALGGTHLHLTTLPLFAAQGLNNYLAARLTWDIDADADLLLEELFTTYYGPAAEPMRRYWRAVERQWALERPAVMDSARPMERPDFWTELEGALQQARHIAAALPPGQRRFADRVQLAADGLEYGRLRYDYDRQFGRFHGYYPQCACTRCQAIYKGLAAPVDHAAALRYLDAHGPRITALEQRYPADDPYWPMLVWPLLRLDVDGLRTAHRAQAAAQ